MTTRISSLAIPALCLAIALMVGLLGTLFDPQYAAGAGGSNQNVTVRLNVSNTEPTVFEVIVDDATDSPANAIDLQAGATTEVLCNASASDPNGGQDMINATADLFASGLSATPFSTLGNASHMRNSTCLEFYAIAGAQNNRSFICRFNMDYFAFNTTWTCNMTVRDNGGSRGPPKVYLNASGSDTVGINQLVAINLTTLTVDYGNLSVTETSAEQNINVTNVGNVRTNFTVLGYGGENQTGLNASNFSMICESGNISIQEERYSNVSGVAFANMIALNGSATVVKNVTLMNRTNDSSPLIDGAYNVTFWKIHVPLSVGGLCNGTIQFSATTAAS